MTTVDLTDEQLENVRREMMKAAAGSLEIAAKALRELGDVARWDVGTRVMTIDTMSAARIARGDLDSIDALGWPENDA